MQTPCKKDCLYSHELKMCESCGRTMQELEYWTQYTREERREHMRAAKERLRKVKEK